MLDDDYPREISVGFDKIPDHVDAAFALPAPGHNGKEKVYFFKGTTRHDAVYIQIFSVWYTEHKVYNKVPKILGSCQGVNAETIRN